MANTQWADVSEFQVPANDRYPWNFFCLRSNDGAHRDKHFSQNFAWANKAVNMGKMFGYLVYYFYRPGFDGSALLRVMVGNPPPARLAVMIDVEGGGGKVSGNQSAAINAQHAALSRWLGDSRRVVGYGNTHDLNALWPTKPSGLRLVIAAYGTNPDYPGKFAHQYADNVPCAPFGPCDANSADNMSQADMEAMFGWATVTPPVPAPTYQSEGDVFLEEPDGTVLWFIADGTNSYYRPLPTNAAKLIPASARIKDDGTLKALWKVGSA